MTKPFTPEFTDRAGAIRYVKAGRKGLTRPTKDAWNTHVELHDDGTGSGEYQARLIHDSKTLLIFYQDPKTKREEIGIYTAPGTSTHTIRKRINDYALHPRHLDLLTDGTVSGPIGKAVGNRGISVPVIGRMGYISGIAVVEDDNSIRGLSATTIHWDMATRRELAARWADAVIANLQAELREDLNAPICIDCSPSGDMRTSVGIATGDKEHMFAHIFGGQSSLSLLVYQLMTSPVDLDMKAVSGSSVYSIGPVTKQSVLTNIRNRCIKAAIAALS